MANRETNVTNAAESTLSAALPSTDTTINVSSTSAFPAVPFYAVIDPDVDAKREIVYVDSSKTATTFVLTSTSSRGVDGTTAVSHSSGAKVVCVPIAALWTDINDRVDAAYTSGGTDVAVADGGTGASTAAGARTNLGLGTAAVENVASFPATTMAGELNLADNLLTRPKLKDYSEEQATPASSAGALTLDMTTANVFEVTLTENTTLTFSNPPASGDAGSFTLILKQDATGSRTVTWPASVDWAGGTAPTLTTTASGVDIFTFLTTDAGTRWYGFTAGQAFA